MKWISTTIKKVWLDKILNCEKVSEFKGATDFWKKRLIPLHGRDDVYINFLCGRDSYKFKVLYVEYFHDSEDNGQDNCFKDIDGVKFHNWFEIRLCPCPMGELPCQWWSYPKNGFCNKPEVEKCPQEHLA